MTSDLTFIYGQRGHKTAFDRYPEIFSETKKILEYQVPKRILSFGCSFGEECKTLNKYFPEAEIHGLDITSEIIQTNNANNTNAMIHYHDNLAELGDKFDLIFAMSVLCYWPERRGNYSFQTFADTIEVIDKLLNKGGHLCIYNSKYLFTDTEICNKRYSVIETEHRETGFVHKYNISGTKVEGYPYFLFQKENL